MDFSKIIDLVKKVIDYIKSIFNSVPGDDTNAK